MTDLYKPRPDRLLRFRFTLRKMFVALTVLAVALVWPGAQVKWIKDRRDAIEWVRSQGLFYISRTLSHGDAETSGTTEHECTGVECQIDHDSRLVDAPAGLRLFGERGYDLIRFTANSSPELAARQRERIAKLFPEAIVEVR